ncbi:hypothetical protein [Sanguibacter antarcticus]|uniref:Uncharacterized protein n=1 Tax=Sanguibacter antarcticus TaxID=372484 RepID=A0A2A9E8G3_9MICO|nr:hypothetical protein [Sanguibacter antarcticus]PFG34851.1 hypothetical protein ATL42_2779 [Sanguibacter antarcticus]
MEFVPFDASEDEVAARQVLRSGVPTSMRAPITNWIWHQMASPQGFVKPYAMHTIENNLDISFGFDSTFTGVLEKKVFLTLLGKRDARNLLRIADWLLAQAGSRGTKHIALQAVLRQGRSQYEVVLRDSSYRLALRLPEGVQAAAEQVMDLGTPGTLLRRAWSKLYDIDPDPSGAYSAAVKAVEAAALPALGISRPTATISDAVRAIERREATWRLPFKREHTEYLSRDVLLGMLKSLYRGQRDRHGSDAYSDVTPEEAEAAVLMAVPLVGWFARGLIEERDVATFG